MADDLLGRLPHAAPFRFLTRLVHIEAGTRGEACWGVTGDESFFRGHFPGRPLVPGVLLIEAMAQLSGLVAFAAGPGHYDRAGPAMLVHSDVRFKHPVSPPAEIALLSTWIRTMGRLAQFEVEARHGGQRIARGTLTLSSGAT